MSSLQAFYAGAFSPTGLGTTLGDVLLDGNVASTDILMNTNDITGAGTVSAVTLTASGAVSGASVTASGAVSGATVSASGAVSGASVASSGTLASSGDYTTGGSIILSATGKSISNSAGALVLGAQAGSTCNVVGSMVMTTTPLQCSYPTFSLSYPNTSIGFNTGNNVGLTVAMNNLAIWSTLYQAPEVLPFGMWLITARVGFSSSDALNTACNVFFSCGINGSATPNQTGGTGGIQTNKGYVNFTTVYQSVDGSQSPTFGYNSDVANCTAFGIAWQAIRIG